MFLSRKQREVAFICIVVYLVACVLKATYLLTNPFLWAEEGSHYLAHAFESGIWDGTFYLPTRTAGYFNLLASGTAVIGVRLFPLEMYPSFTTFFSVIYVGIIVVYLCIVRLDVVITNKIRVVWTLLLVISPSVTGEVWLNTINLQVYAGLFTAIILLSKEERAFVVVFESICLFFNGLSGIYSVIGAPLFVLKAIQDKGCASILRAVVISFTLLVQLVAFLYLKQNDLISEKKVTEFDLPQAVYSVVHYQILAPMLGEENSKRIFITIGEWDVMEGEGSTSRDVNKLLLIFVLLGMVGLTAWYFNKNWKGKRFGISLLVLYLWCLYFVTSYFSVGKIPGGRYAVFPGVLLQYLILFELDRRRCLFQVLFTMFSFGLLYNGFKVRENDYNKYYAPVENYPIWSTQVNEWRIDNRRNLLVRPEVPTVKYGWWPLTLFPYSSYKEINEGFRILGQIGEGYTVEFYGPLSKMFRIYLDGQIEENVDSLNLEIRSIGHNGMTIGVEEYCVPVRKNRFVYKVSCRGSSIGDGRAIAKLQLELKEVKILRVEAKLGGDLNSLF